MSEPGRLDCESARERISAASDGEAAATPELDAHVEGCPACREFAARCGELARAFDGLRDAAPPADLATRLLARAPAQRLVATRGGAVWRAAAGLVGLLGVGAIAVASESRRGGAAPDAGAGWSEPLSGRALHPDDAPLRTWAEAMGKVVSEERR